MSVSFLIEISPLEDPLLITIKVSAKKRDSNSSRNWKKSTFFVASIEIKMRLNSRSRMPTEKTPSYLLSILS